MVGIVIVSHSARLAEGVAELARGVGGGDVALAATGGLDLPDHPLGTDAMLVLQAIETVYSDDGVLVLMDLGSAVLSAELARDLLPEERRDYVLLCEAPLVEGAVAAAVQARLGSSLTQVAAEARGALAAKAAHLSATGEALEVSQQPPVAATPRAWEERRVRVLDPAGLHARPAAAFVQAASRFRDTHVGTHVTVANLTGGRGPVEATSINAVITLGVRQGDELLLAASGPDAAAALDALADLIHEHRGETEIPLPAAPAVASETAEGWPLQGTPASPGIAVGSVHLHRPAAEGRPAGAPPAADPQAEWQALADALARTAEHLRAMRDAIADRAGGSAAGIFTAQLLFLDDPALLAPARAAIFEQKRSAAAAWQAAVERMVEGYAALDDAHLRSRSADLVAVAGQVLDHLAAQPATFNLAAQQQLATAEPGILVARDLSTADVAGLDPDTVLGVCTALGAPTSHAAILARALGIPYVTGLGDALLALPAGIELAMDGGTGQAWPEPPPAVVAGCAAAAAAERAVRAEARKGSAATAATRDGHRIEVAANIGSIPEAAAAVRSGADSVGVFRTEFLFVQREDPPGEAEQTAAYRAAAVALAGRPLIIRTLDAGGDKPLPYLHLPVEANPFLGVRALRIGLAQPEMFRVQLRAIARVAAEFLVKIMFPMVATLAEWHTAVNLLAAARAELLARGDPAADRIETGIMVEIPAAAVLAREFAAEVDFLSIGTNDLTQYTLAADRGNPQLAGLGDQLQPAVLRLIRDVVAAGHAHGKWVGVCGELGADPLAIPLLVGLGVDELSMNAAAIPQAKQIIRGLDYAAAQALAGEVLHAGSVEAVRSRLRVGATRPG